jgi:hypothetical protein
MQTPAEALAELDHASELGYRAVVFSQYASRIIPQFEGERSSLIPYLQRPDFFGLDSAFDYDPVWQKCMDLGLAATFHALGNGPGPMSRGSVSNFVFNRIGTFARLHYQLAAALVLGGVPHRFPDLNMAFLEGGVHWACALLNDLVGMWEKRSLEGLRHMDPERLDQTMLFDLVERYGDEATLTHMEAIRAHFTREQERPVEMDQFAATGVQSAKDIVTMFSHRLFFGCEGDDLLYGMAFDSKKLPLDTTLRAFYGSDISHWDVPDMVESLEEALEPVESGAVTREQFRKFSFVNPVELHGRMNPNFFDGTRVEAAAKELLESI